MAEHSLQRIVQLVRDARHELSERREFLRLHEPVAQLGALRFELRLRRDVARDQYDADRLAFFPREQRERDDEGAAEFGIDDLSRDSRRGLSRVEGEWLRRR